MTLKPLITNRDWEIHEDECGFIILPRNDRHSHDLYNENCDFNPVVTRSVGGTRLLTHRAFDFRDVVKWLNDPNRKSDLG